jgi:cytoskeletal protein CcmA (bactofilin family)
MNAHDVSVIGEDTSLSGRLKGQDLVILGAFEGELNLSGRLQLGPRAKVKATVRAEVVDIEGTFDGEVRAKSLTFAPTAHGRGLFLADRLGIREGAVVEGSFNLPTESDARRVEARAIEVKAEPAVEPPVEPPVSEAPAARPDVAANPSAA